MTTDPTAFVFNLVVTFCGEVARHVEGSPTHTHLVQANKSTFAKFKQGILSTAPLFVPFEADNAPDDPDTAKYSHLAGEVKNDVEIQGARSSKALYLGDVRQRIQSYVAALNAPMIDLQASSLLTDRSLESFPTTSLTRRNDHSSSISKSRGSSKLWHASRRSTVPSKTP